MSRQRDKNGRFVKTALPTALAGGGAVDQHQTETITLSFMTPVGVQEVEAEVLATGDRYFVVDLQRQVVAVARFRLRSIPYDNESRARLPSWFVDMCEDDSVIGIEEVRLETHELWCRLSPSFVADDVVPHVVRYMELAKPGIPWDLRQTREATG